MPVLSLHPLCGQLRTPQLTRIVVHCGVASAVQCEERNDLRAEPANDMLKRHDTTSSRPLL